MFWPLRTSARERELSMQLEITTRQLAIAQAEIESLAAVIARDRARVQAETAEFCRRRAEAETK